MRVGTPRFIGARLREAREARGMTCQQLASHLGVTRSSVSNYENNIQTPSPDVLQHLVGVLGLPTHYYTRQIPPQTAAAQFFRSFNSATKQSRIIVGRRYEWFREIAAFVHQFVKFPEVNVPKLVSGREHELVSLDDTEHMASVVRKHWDLGDRPISNVIWLLELKGIACCRFRFGTTTLDAFSEWRNVRPFVVLSSDKGSCVRSRYDAAHELAHMVLHRDVPAEELVNYSRFSLIEQQANAFAAAFLMPASTFSEDFIPSLDGLRDLKRKWLVSIGAMVHRGRSLNLISEVQEKNLWRQIGRRKWRTREPLDDLLPPEEPEYLRKSVALLEKRGISSARDIAFQLGLSESEVNDLCCINKRMELDLAMEPGEKATESHDSRAIIPFPTQVG
jgi:Zn-dependent peptidase ImmA (M78 family)/transcriptional regulator with XRE-family HTH domain